VIILILCIDNNETVIIKKKSQVFKVANECLAEKMSTYLKVSEDEGEEPIEVPTEEDSTLLLSTLQAQFPGASGLKFRNPDSGGMRGVRITEGRFHPPESGWGTNVFVCVFPKGIHRKCRLILLYTV